MVWFPYVEQLQPHVHKDRALHDLHELMSIYMRKPMLTLSSVNFLTRAKVCARRQKEKVATGLWHQQGKRYANASRCWKNAFFWEFSFRRAQS